MQNKGESSRSSTRSTDSRASSQGQYADNTKSAQDKKVEAGAKGGRSSSSSRPSESSNGR